MANAKWKYCVVGTMGMTHSCHMKATDARKRARRKAQVNDSTYQVIPRLMEGPWKLAEKPAIFTARGR